MHAMQSKTRNGTSHKGGIVRLVYGIVVRLLYQYKITAYASSLPIGARCEGRVTHSRQLP
jgi:hypothetical protein